MIYKQYIPISLLRVRLNWICPLLWLFPSILGWRSVLFSCCCVKIGKNCWIIEGSTFIHSVSLLDIHCWGKRWSILWHSKLWWYRWSNWCILLLSTLILLLSLASTAWNESLRRGLMSSSSSCYRFNLFD